ncbi:MAG: hypothetical protein ACYDHG_09830, partial [Desulfomonilaceae bacterium]
HKREQWFLRMEGDGGQEATLSHPIGRPPYYLRGNLQRTFDGGKIPLYGIRLSIEGFEEI